MSYDPTEVRQLLREIRQYMPRVRSARWARLDPPFIQEVADTIAVADRYRRDDGLRAFVSLDPPLTATVQWFHVSASFPDRCPSWADMCDVHINLLGDVYAVQMHVPKSEAINHHPYTLHLWRNVIGPTVPDEGIDRMPMERSLQETPR